MSKELIEVKQEGTKSKLKELVLWIFICILGSAVVFVSFFISYKKINSGSLLNNGVSHIEVIPETENEEVIIDDKKEENAEEEENEDIDEEITVEEANIKLPYWNDTAVEDIKNIYGSDEKQIYLTFDDGPSEEVTPAILAILKKQEVPATFFVLGKCVDKYPELVKQAYEDGHYIANHGYTHTYSKIYSSVDSVWDEYNKANESIRNAIDNPNYDPHLFRFPGGSSGGPYDSLKSQAKQFLADNQVASTNWNSLTSDAAGKTTVSEQYYEVLDTQGDKTSLIILLHDAADKTVTPETLKLIIKHYKEEGYEFKNFYDIFSEKEEVIDQEEYEEENLEDL